MRLTVSLLAMGVFAGTLCDPCRAATIRGTVTDPSRAVIASARATIKNESTGVVRAAATNAAGVFSFTDLAVGSYQVEVASAGFKTSAIRGIALDVADVRALDVGLEVGDVAEELSVDASGLAVQTVGGEVAGVVSGDEARELPLNGRNFLQLVVLTPGVSPSDFVNLRERALFSLANISVSGGPANGNLYTVDGANNMDVGSNNAVLVSPSVDAIEEFKIHRNSYGAEYGQSAFTQRPNRVFGRPCRASGGPLEQVLDPAAFTLTGFELGTFGTSGAGACDGPGFFRIDLALYKTIRLGRRVRAELRFEVFNLLNTTEFFNVITAMNPLSIEYDAPLESASRVIGYELPRDFGRALNARDPRQAQLGLKLVF
jgi:hypothetical protein